MKAAAVMSVFGLCEAVSTVAMRENVAGKSCADALVVCHGGQVFAKAGECAEGLAAHHFGGFGGHFSVSLAM